MWAMPLSSVRFVPRDVPLPVVRIASMFVTKQDEKTPEIVDESKMTDIEDKVSSFGIVVEFIFNLDYQHIM